MRCNNVLGLIFAGTFDEKMPDLTSSRTMASVPIGGKYRIIDFVLSNMSNSGINNVGVVATKNYLSLADHLGSGSPMTFQREEVSLRYSHRTTAALFQAILKPSIICTDILKTAGRNTYFSLPAILFLTLTAPSFLIFTPKRAQIYQ